MLDLDKLPNNFLKKVAVNPENGCWEWKAYKNPEGYGKVTLYHGEDGYSSYYTHRLVYQSLVGPIPEGMEIDHICENRSCCNPVHLRVLTHLQNVQRGKWIKRPCPHGPETERYDWRTTGCGACKECKKESNREYYLKKKAEKEANNTVHMPSDEYFYLVIQERLAS